MIKIDRCQTYNNHMNTCKIGHTKAADTRLPLRRRKAVSQKGMPTTFKKGCMIKIDRYGTHSKGSQQDQIFSELFWPLCKIGRAKAANPRPPLQQRKAAMSKGIPQGQLTLKKVAWSKLTNVDLISKDLQYFPRNKPEEQDNVAKGVHYRTEASD